MPRSPAVRKGVALLLWLALLAVFLVAASRHPGGVVGVLETVLRAIRRSPDGLALLAGIYLVRPLLLLPVTILTAFCGYLFGPLWGVAIAHTAAVASASAGYLAVRWWRGGRPVAADPAWTERLRRGTFETVLVSRLSFVPGDLVNGVAGALALPFAPFAAATALGGLPGTVVGVLAGAAMHGEGFRAAAVHVRPGFIAASLALAALSLAVAVTLRRRGRGSA
ncbi:MAG: VTT domain-containing protein [Deinococcales bacterium]